MGMRRPGTLTAKQKRFCEAVVENGYNYTQAYLTAYPTAGYDTGNSSWQAILKKPEAQEYIKQLQEDAVKAAGISAAKILKELDKIAMDPESTKMERIKAFDLLSKNLGVQTQKISADVNANVNMIEIGLDDGPNEDAD